MTVTSSSGITVTYDPNGTGTTQPIPPPEVIRAEEVAKEVRRANARDDELRKKILGHGASADLSYSAANGENFAPSMEALIPYFASLQQGSDWVEFIEAVKDANAARAKKQRGASLRTPLIVRLLASCPRASASSQSASR